MIDMIITTRLSWLLMIALLNGATTGLRAQQAGWKIYNKDNSELPDNQVQAIVIARDDQKWIGTANGLACFDGENWTNYHPGNSPLPSSFISALVVDRNGKLWIGTDKGLATYHNGNWKVYTSGNSPVRNLVINKIVYDEIQNVVWISNETVLFKFDGNKWTQYDDSNSYIFQFFVIQSMVVDKNGILWVGVFDVNAFNGRLLRYDGINWQSERLDHHGMTSTFPYSLAVDHDNSLWMGTGGTTGGVLVHIRNNTWTIFDKSTSPYIGGARAILKAGKNFWFAGNGITIYDGKTWSGYDTRNSELPDDYTYTLAVDKHGSAWVGTISGGLAAYKPFDGASQPGNPNVIYNFPNPFSHTTTIRYKVPVFGKVRISIYDIAGHHLSTVLNENKPAGDHSLVWNAGHLASGIYYYRVYNNKEVVTGRMMVAR